MRVINNIWCYRSLCRNCVNMFCAWSKCNDWPWFQLTVWCETHNSWKDSNVSAIAHQSIQFAQLPYLLLFTIATVKNSWAWQTRQNIITSSKARRDNIFCTLTTSYHTTHHTNFAASKDAILHNDFFWRRRRRHEDTTNKKRHGINSEYETV